jgi:hypothetical protein
MRFLQRYHSSLLFYEQSFVQFLNKLKQPTEYKKGGDPVHKDTFADRFRQRGRNHPSSFCWLSAAERLPQSNFCDEAAVTNPASYTCKLPSGVLSKNIYDKCCINYTVSPVFVKTFTAPLLFFRAANP